MQLLCFFDKKMIPEDKAEEEPVEWHAFDHVEKSAFKVSLC